MCRGCEPWEEVTHTHFASTRTYHYTVVTFDFVKAGGVGLTLLPGTILLVIAVGGFKVVVINIVTDEDIGKVFQEHGFADTCLSNQKDGVRCWKLVVRCLDDPFLERLDVTRKYG